MRSYRQCSDIVASEPQLTRLQHWWGHNTTLTLTQWHHHCSLYLTISCLWVWCHTVGGVSNLQWLLGDDVNKRPNCSAPPQQCVLRAGRHDKDWHSVQLIPEQLITEVTWHTNSWSLAFSGAFNCISWSSSLNAIYCVLLRTESMSHTDEDHDMWLNPPETSSKWTLSCCRKNINSGLSHLSQNESDCFYQQFAVGSANNGNTRTEHFLFTCCRWDDTLHVTSFFFFF